MTTNDLLTAAPMVRALEHIKSEAHYSCCQCTYLDSPCNCFLDDHITKALAQSETITRHSEALWRVLGRVINAAESDKDKTRELIKQAYTDMDNDHAEEQTMQFGIVCFARLLTKDLPPELFDIIKQRGGG